MAADLYQADGRDRASIPDAARMTTQVEGREEVSKTWAEGVLLNTTAVLKAMANDRRLSILFHLCQGEKSVTEIEELVDLNQSALSQHLARLRRDNLVKTRREAQRIIYSLASNEVHQIILAILRLHVDEAPPDIRQRIEAAGR